MALTKASNSMITGAHYSVLDYGADPTGITSSTSAFQAAIEAAQAEARPIDVPAGTYLIDDTLTVYNGTQLIGDTNFAVGASYSRPVYATTIQFEPASGKPLFNYEWKGTGPGRIFHTAIKNLYMTTSDPLLGTYGLKLNGVMYSVYENLMFEGFNVGVYCDATINNRLQNIQITNAGYVCVDYAGNAETTDVWEQCNFFGSPVGVRFNGPSVGVRFNNCLWEQITYYGMDVSSRCQSTMVVNGYCEDVPYGASPPADGCMFRVGQVSGDSSADVNNHLIVLGGEFNGRNAGIAGAGLFDVGICWGIHATGFVANRWPYIIATDVTNTNPNSIVLGGYQGISWSNNIDNIDKVCGIYPNGVLNTGSFNSIGKFSSISAASTATADGGFVNYGSRVWLSGGGSPEGAVTAAVGSIYSRTDGGAGTSFYVKESGTGNTGWAAK